MPGLILDPEEGMEAAIYAKNKGIDYSFNANQGGFPGLPGFEGEGEDINGVKVHGGGHLEQTALSIEEQFKKITQAHGAPKEKDRLVSVAESTMGSGTMTPKESVISKAVDRLSRPKAKDVKPLKKDKRGADLLFDMFEGPSNNSSGYATNESSNSTAKNPGTPPAPASGKTRPKRPTKARQGSLESVSF